MNRSLEWHWGNPKVNRATVSLHGLLCRFEQPDNTIAGMSVADWRPLFGNRTYKFAGHEPQSLAGIQVWCEHVTISVACEHPFPALRVMDHGDSLVVNLDLLGRFHVVVENHLPAAPNERSANLHGSQPVEVEVGDHTAFEMGGNIGNVLEWTIEVLHARGGNRHRFGIAQVIHDGKIVWRQIPDHVDIALDQAKADSDRVKVEDVTHVARIDQRSDATNGRGVKEGVINHH